jgi:signal transduction histidine kinase
MTTMAERDVRASASRSVAAGVLAPCFVAASIATTTAVAAAVVAAADAPRPIEIVRPVVVVLWVAAGVMLGLRRRRDRLAGIVLLGAMVGGVGSLAAAVVDHDAPDTSAGWDLALRLSIALLPAVTMHVLVGLPDGRLVTPTRRAAVVGYYGLAAAIGGAMMADRSDLTVWPIALLWVVAAVVGVYAAKERYATVGAHDRQRMQWLGWGIAVAAEAGIVIVALRLLVDWPAQPGAVALAITGVIPVALMLGTLPTMASRVDRLLYHTVAIAGLTGLVVAVYVVVVLGFGRTPTGQERNLLLLSMVAAGVCAMLYLPAHRRLVQRAHRVVYGERVAPEELLRTFSQRLTRSIPMDELLLQLTELLRTSMTLQSAEVWTGQHGRFDLAAGVPHRQAASMTIGPKEAPVVARSGVSGGTWLEIWVPAIIGPNGSAAMRFAPVAHAGELLGFIAVTRRPDAEAFTEDEDRLLTELARQVGLALHNVQLDAALQASLGELQVRNDELQQSRARIVASADAERRRLERNLHDGAQQHLVALAVKLRLVRDAVEDDPADAILMVDEIKLNLQDAIQELRSLAHGIFPPLLVSGGLGEALPAAAARAALPVDVDTTGIGRYAGEMEAAVYFCILEALQNAAKHAGDGASVLVSITEQEGSLRFEVTDDGVGFDASRHGGQGHGFINMADRLGAFGGTLSVRSAPGEGTTITGTLPCAPGERTAAP